MRKSAAQASTRVRPSLATDRFTACCIGVRPSQTIDSRSSVMSARFDHAACAKVIVHTFQFDMSATFGLACEISQAALVCPVYAIFLHLMPAIQKAPAMSPKMFDLSGRTALVTGSSRGLGRAMAEGLAAAGAKLIVNGTDAARVDAAVAEMRAKGIEASASAFNVTSEAAIITAFEKFDADKVSIDILVNNAGIQFRKPMVELATADWQRVIDTNLTSAFVIGREAAKRMIPRQRGKIINIGSLTSALARATIAPYTVAKGGVKMLTQAMAAEWGASGIQANAIGPGYMLTEMNTALINNPDFDAWVKNRTPAKRWGKAEELVGTAVFLASSASDYVNGQIIYVDGGIMAVL